MHSPCKHPLLALFGLAAYLTAATAGGLLHSHEHEASADHIAHCGHHHACHGEHAATDVPAPPADHHDDDCAACRFLAQPVAPVAAVEPDRHHEASTPLAIHHSAEPVSSARELAHARAPPHVG